MTLAATLEWRRETWNHRPGYLWRLYAPAAVRDAIGGAPCHVGAQIGSCAYGDASYYQDRRGWQASAELTPYDSVKTPVRGTHKAARRNLESIISARLLAHGFTSLTFTESIIDPAMGYDRRDASPQASAAYVAACTREMRA